MQATFTKVLAPVFIEFAEEEHPMEYTYHDFDLPQKGAYNVLPGEYFGKAKGPKVVAAPLSELRKTLKSV